MARRKILERLHTPRTPLGITVLILLLVLVGIGSYKGLHRGASTGIKSTSLLQAQKNDTKKPTQGATSNAEGGGVVDNPNLGNNSQASGSVSSPSGAISLSQPKNGDKITTGSTVRGAASVSQVQYRIKDNIRGVIAQGTLSVVNGAYGGTISIQPTGNSGTFEVYDFNTYGVEENNIKINVNF